ncbi:hypothetical protein QLZ26_08820 [Cronobacter universalis]|uniref:hypothetical protein n=1 Tax=Cronobacter universalis TaxID=535744 RepID=UPI0024AFDFAA|nr:hypothetical protein [Cronobacter universalis]MDI7660207.1 hypothetical protein [Cronobacter universalis]
MTKHPLHSTLKMQSRAIMILEAACKAGINPLPAEVFHNIAYFSNLLAPVYGSKIMDGKVLRLKEGPYYPDLQNQLDWLVLCGLVSISNLKYLYLEEIKNWRLFANYAINIEKTTKIVYQLNQWKDESLNLEFIKKITLALTELSNSEITNSNKFDATYADKSTDFGNVIDYGEWVEGNPSLNAIKLMEKHFSGYQISDDAKLNFYVRHLYHQIQKGRTSDE